MFHAGLCTPALELRVRGQSGAVHKDYLVHVLLLLFLQTGHAPRMSKSSLWISQTSLRSFLQPVHALQSNSFICTVYDGTLVANDVHPLMIFPSSTPCL